MRDRSPAREVEYTHSGQIYFSVIRPPTTKMADMRSADSHERMA